MSANKRMLFSAVERAAVMSLAVCVVLSMLSFGEDCGGIRSKVLRLHIIANSDTVSDQTLKLLVRDRVLEYSRDIFSGCTDLDGAVERARGRLGGIEAAAREALMENGCDSDVRVSVSRDWFPTRRYDGAVLPAGMYSAVRIEIGRAKGHNWWCVMFPMMCVPSSGGCGAEDILSDSERRIVEMDGYDVRFRCVEVFERLRSGGGN